MSRVSYTVLLSYGPEGDGGDNSVVSILTHFHLRLFKAHMFYTVESFVLMGCNAKGSKKNSILQLH